MFKAVLLLILLLSLRAQGAERAAATDFVDLPALPHIGKWLVDKNGHVAHWLGNHFRGHLMDEPINLFFRVNAETEIDATEIFLNRLMQAGFVEVPGHSSGYIALLGNNFLSQTANHGRAFGPVLFNGAYYFSAAFSREEVDYLCDLVCASHQRHRYFSFNMARETLSNELIQKSGAKFLGYLSLENAMNADDKETTGDHDGYAIFLELQP
jgi:hypothetical protein